MGTTPAGVPRSLGYTQLAGKKGQSPLAILRLAALCWGLLFAACTAGPKPEPADLVVVNGKIYPGGAPVAEAVAVRGDRILAVETNAEIEKNRSDSTKVVDAKGGTVRAGLNDAHVHFLSGGESLDRVDLFYAKTVEEAQRTIRDFAAESPDKPWVLGRGWRRRNVVFRRLGNLVSSANDVGLVSVAEQQMSARLRDLSDDSRQELESVHCFEAREKLPRLVMRGLGSVEHVSRAFAPLQSG
jgi:Amidohydrolase family